MALKAVDYDGRQHTVYAQGRSISAEETAKLMAAFVARAPARRPLTVLDLGSGIGRLTPALAATFGGPVYGVEPSAGMRAVAEAQATAPGVTYREGAAEAIPLADASCDLVLMFLSFHHVRDRPAAAREIARVLAPGGRVLIRSHFRERMPLIAWHAYFSRARTVELLIYPALAEVEELFGGVGLRRVALDQILERHAEGLKDYAARLRLRAVSTFEYLDEAETAEGFERLDAAAAAEIVATPVETLSDLLVLG